MASWITNIQPSAGSGNATVTITMQSNSGASRNATIRVKGGGVPDSTFTLTQQAVQLHAVQLLARTSAIQPYQGASTPDEAMNNLYTFTMYATQPATQIGIGTRFYTSSGAQLPMQADGNWYKVGSSDIAVMIDAGGYYLQSVDTSQFITLPSSETFTASGGAKSISVTSNTDWVVSNSPTWITISGGSGSGNGSFTATATQNTGNSRSGSISVRSADGMRVTTMSVSQAAAAASAGVFPSNIQAGAQGGAYYVEVRASGGQNWTVNLPISLPFGFTVTPMSGSGTNMNVRIDVPQNFFNNPLLHSFDVIIGGVSYLVVVNQAGQPF